MSAAVGSPRRRLAAGLAAGVVWALPVGMLRAQSTDASDAAIEQRIAAACQPPADAPAAETAAAPREAHIDLLRNDPPAALRAACARTPGAAGEQRARAWLEVAEASAAVVQVEATKPLVYALLQRPEFALSTAALRRARLHLLRGQFDAETGDDEAGRAEFVLAEAAFRAAGAQRSRYYAATLVGLAQGERVAREPGGLARAEAYLAQAQALLESIGLAVSRDMTDVVNQRTVVAYARQDLPGTARWARAEIDIYRALGLGDDAELLHPYATLGAVLSQLSRFDEAREALTTGERIVDAHPEAEPAGRLGVLTNLAAFYLDRGEPRRAGEVADRSLQLAETVYGPTSARVLVPLLLRAQSEAALTLYAAARRTYERALAVTAAHGRDVGPLRVLRLRDGLAAVDLALGETDAARAVLAQALEVVGDDPQLSYWRGRVQRRLGSMAAREGQWAEADQRQADAASLIGPVVGDQHPYVIEMLAERCVAQSRGPIPGTACADLEPLLGLLQGAAPGFRFRAWAALAVSAEGRGLDDIALQRHLQALAAAQTAATPDPLWSALDALAQHLRRRGDHRLSVLFAKQAIEQIEGMRSDLGADAARFERGFLVDKLGVYRRLADWLTEDGRIDEALEILRLLKQEEYYDFVSRDGSLLSDGGGASLWAGVDAALRQRWEQLSAAPQPKSAPAPTAAPVPAEAEADRVARWREFLVDNADPRAAAATAPLGASLAASAGTVARGELRVWAYAGPHHVNLVIDALQRREVLRVEVEPAAMAREVGQLLSRFGRREPVMAQVQQLYRELGAPLDAAAQRAGATRIVLQLDGALRYLPFAALHDGTRYLGERYSIEQRVATATPPGAAAVRVASEGGASALRPIELRAVGVTRALGGMVALRAVAREVCGIVAGPVNGLEPGDPACAGRPQGQGVLAGEAWLNELFTAERLRTAASASAGGRRDMLHVGTHFVLRPGNMGRSWLLLGDGQRFTLDELAKMSFDGQELVTLSACETGLGGSGDAATGLGLEGLNTLVMRRGARAVLASLWRVEDDSTSALMLQFYRAVRRPGVTPAQALREAQRAVRLSSGGRWADPFYWAGFVVTTRDRP